MKGWISVNLSTRMIDSDNKKRKAARACLEMYILWKNIEKDERY